MTPFRLTARVPLKPREEERKESKEEADRTDLRGAMDRPLLLNKKTEILEGGTKAASERADATSSLCSLAHNTSHTFFSLP